MNYLYKITNLINNKVYIGVHKTNNINDNYMGSGTAITRAIKKYGVENFQKEILEFFSTYDEALQREQEIVDNNFILREDTYNLRSGGIGGFEHINFLSKDERINIKKFKEKVASGELKVGGTAHWSPESYKKAANQARLNNLWRHTSGWTHTEESKKIIREKVSGKNNGNYGKIWCVEISALDCKNRKSFNKNEIPKNWIPCTDWQDRKKNKSSSAYGRHWYNDGVKNYYLYPTDKLIKELNLEKRRLISKIR